MKDIEIHQIALERFNRINYTETDERDMQMSCWSSVSCCPFYLHLMAVQLPLLPVIDLKLSIQPEHSESSVSKDFTIRLH